MNRAGSLPEPLLRGQSDQRNGRPLLVNVRSISEEKNVRRVRSVAGERTRRFRARPATGWEQRKLARSRGSKRVNGVRRRD